MNLDLRSADGAPVSLLTTGKNREVDAAVLRAAADAQLEDSSLAHCLHTPLSDIAKSPREEAAQALVTVRDMLASYLGDLDPADRERFADEQADPLVDFATDLVESSIFWAAVAGRPEDRTLVKVAFEDPIYTESNRRRRLLSTLGWQAIAAEYAIPHIGKVGIYHCQIEPPAELQMERAKLVLEDPPLYGGDPYRPEDERDNVTSPVPSMLRDAPRALRDATKLRWAELFGVPPKDEKAEIEPPPGETYARVARGRAHLYVSGARRGFGVASLRMSVASRALTTASLTSAVVVALLLTALFLLADAAVDEKGPTIATLLLVPGLVSFLARPQEHPLARRYLTGVRTLTLISASTSVGAAIVLVGHRNPSVADVLPWWPILMGIAWLCALLLLVSWLFPAPPPQAGR